MRAELMDLEVQAVSGRTIQAVLRMVCNTGPEDIKVAYTRGRGAFDSVLGDNERLLDHVRTCPRCLDEVALALEACLDDNRERN